jgi:alkyl hydroperoxide reductase subunit AhpC
MAWTFVCPTEIIAFSERASDFAARGASVVFASTDSEYSLLAWTNASRKDGGLGKINIPLLSDKNHSLSKDYGVLIEDEGIALRGLFLIDPAGVVRQVSGIACGGACGTGNHVVAQAGRCKRASAFDYTLTCVLYRLLSMTCPSAAA